MDRPPLVGQAVTYLPHPGAPVEDGKVKSVNPETGVAIVLYDGDQTAKATRIIDLMPGRPSSAW